MLENLQNRTRSLRHILQFASLRVIELIMEMAVSLALLFIVLFHVHKD